MIKSRVLRLALVGVAVSAMAACARPAEAPGPITDNGGTQPGNNTTYPDRPVTGGEMGAARPGSVGVATAAFFLGGTIGSALGAALAGGIIEASFMPRV